MKIPAFPNVGRFIRRFKLAAGQTFLEGAAVLLANGEVSECGADPTSILGFALHAAGADPEPGFVLVAVAQSNSTFWVQGTTDPVLADEGESFGIVRDADGIWILDHADTTQTRLIVERADLDRKLYEVRVLPANRQLA